MKEKWRDISGYEGLYKVSSSGKVCSCERTVNHYKGSRIVRSRILKTGLSMGYPSISLWKNNKGKSFKIHKLVVDAFKDKILIHGGICNHKDGNKKNNTVENLESITYSENSIHAYKIGLNKNTKKVICLDSGEIFPSLTSAAKKIGAFPNHVWMVCVGRQRICKGYKFEYYQKEN